VSYIGPTFRLEERGVLFRGGCLVSLIGEEIFFITNYCNVNIQQFNSCK